MATELSAVPTGQTRAALFKIARNAVALLSSDVFSKATTFVLYLMVSRYLGLESYSQMTLALTLFYTFQVICVAGLKTLVTREVAKDTTETRKYFSNALLIIVTASTLSMLLLFAFIAFMGYDVATAKVILLISLGLMPFAISMVCEAIFQAWERMQFIAYANVPINLFRLLAGFLLLTTGGSLVALVSMLAISQMLLVIIELSLLFSRIIKPKLEFDLGFARLLLKKTSTFWGIDVVIAIWASLQILLLSRLSTTTDVGLYGSAMQLLVPANLVFQSVVISLFPTMTRKAKDVSELKAMNAQVLEFLLALSLPAALSLFFLSDKVLLLLYGEADFVRAASVLQVLAWLLVITSLTQALGHVLYASSKEHVTLRIVIVNSVLSLVLGMILITQFGLMGAAWTAFITAVVNFFQHYVPVSRVLSGVPLSQALWKPLLGCLALAAFYLLTNFGLFPSLLLAAMLYLFVLVVLDLIALGGLTPFKAKYAFLLRRA